MKGLTKNRFFETWWINVSLFSQFSHVTLYPPMPKNDLQAKPSCPQRVLAPCFNLWGHTAADHWCGEDKFVLFLCVHLLNEIEKWTRFVFVPKLYLQQPKLCKFIRCGVFLNNQHGHLFQDEKNQLLITCLWLNLVSFNYFLKVWLTSRIINNTFKL